MTIIRSTIAAVALLAASFPAMAQSEEWVTKTTDKSVEETVSALEAAIEGAGASVMATVDHAANASSADLELSPTTVVIFGNPNIGTPLMQENRRIAIDLPQKMLIWDENGQTMIGYVAPTALAARYGLDPKTDSIAKMTGALDRLSSAAAGNP